MTRDTSPPLSQLGRAALLYAEQGYAVFPLLPRSKVPFGGSQGFKDATCDVQQVRDWWTTQPTANVGIATGQADGKLDVYVFDLDPAQGGTLAAARALLKGALPATRTVKTGGGGWHFYLSLPAGLSEEDVRSSAGALGPGLDVRGTGGYVVAPPSVHPSGVLYAWHKGSHSSPLLPIPEALLEAIRVANEARTGQITHEVMEQPLITGKRNVTLYKFGCSLVRKGWDFDLISDTLFAVNARRCQPPLDDKEVHTVAAHAWEKRTGEKSYLNYLAEEAAEPGSGGRHTGGGGDGEDGPVGLPAHLTPTDVEQHLLGVVLWEVALEPEAREEGLLALTTSLVRADQFYDRACKRAFEMLIAMSKAGLFLDPTTIAANLTEAAPLALPPEYPTWAACFATWQRRVTDSDPDLVRSLCRTILKAFRGRAAWQVAEQQKQDIADGLDAGEVALRSATLLETIASEQGDPSEDLIAQHVNAYLDLVALWERRGSGILSGKSFGIRGLDTLLDGMQDEELILCGGRSSMGKTAFAITTILRLSQQCEAGHYVGLVSLEMSARAVIHRMVSMLSGYSMSDIRKAWPHVDFSSVRNAAEVVRKLPIFLVDGGESVRVTNRSGGVMTVDAMRSRALGWRRLGALDFLAVDYLELIDVAPEKRRDKGDEQLGDTAHRLKKLAMEMKLPVMVLAQLNREGEKTSTKVPTGVNFRGSDRPFHIADIVLLVYRADYYLERGQGIGEEAAPPKGYTAINIEKNRNGPTGQVPCYFRSKTAQFYDWDDTINAPVTYLHHLCPWYAQDQAEEAGLPQRTRAPEPTPMRGGSGGVGSTRSKPTNPGPMLPPKRIAWPETLAWVPTPALPPEDLADVANGHSTPPAEVVEPPTANGYHSADFFQRGPTPEPNAADGADENDHDDNNTHDDGPAPPRED